MKTLKLLAVGVIAGAVVGGGGIALLLSNSNSDPQQTAAGPRGGGGPGGGRPARRAYKPTVAMALAKEASVTKTINVLGEARALKSIAITSEVTGLVEEVNIAPGKRVKQGEMILRVVDDAQSIALARTRAQYPIAKANAERYRQLAAEDAASPLEADEAFNELKRLEAELRSAELEKGQRTITAPLDGIAGITEIETGDYLRAGDVITTLDDTSSVVIEFSVPQESAAYVELGQDVSAGLTSDAGRAFKGSITAIDSRIDSASRTLRAEATIENGDGVLLPGAVFAVSTLRAGAKAVSVPGLAVQWDRAGAYVWKRGDDGMAVRASVQILQRRDDIVLVQGDVRVGDAIAADGADRVRAGLELPVYERSSSAPQVSVSGVPSAVGAANN